MQILGELRHISGCLQQNVVESTQQAHKRLVNVYITFTIEFRIGSECRRLSNV